MFEGMKKKHTLLSPTTGRLLPLSQVPDEAFSSGMLGKGFAIDPTEGCVYCPMDATLSSIADGKHAYTLTTPDGLDLLIHVGVDTVELDGHGFSPVASVGEALCAGDVIARFSPERIREKGLCTYVITLITNPELLQEFSIASSESSLTGGRDSAAFYRISKKG